MSADPWFTISGMLLGSLRAATTLRQSKVIQYQGTYNIILGFLRLSKVIRYQGAYSSILGFLWQPFRRLKKWLPRACLGPFSPFSSGGNWHKIFVLIFQQRCRVPTTVYSDGLGRLFDITSHAIWLSTKWVGTSPERRLLWKRGSTNLVLLGLLRWKCLARGTAVIQNLRRIGTKGRKRAGFTRTGIFFGWANGNT